jgi:16S rRNA (adenine1518-N6/adenine1519-N6)-dimethyltransferase
MTGVDAESLARQAERLTFVLDPAALDQHLLVRTAVVDELVALADVGPDDVVLDVGSGAGVIAATLATRCARVLAVELDPRFEPILRHLSAAVPGVQVLMTDVLALDLAATGANKIVANPPFRVLEPLLKRLADTPSVRLAALVLGRSSAGDLVAPAGSAGFTRLSLLAQAYFDVSVAAAVPRTAFHPAPRVDASILLLRRPARPTPRHRVLRLLSRAALVRGGTRVRDVAAAVPVRLRDAGAVRIDTSQLTDPGIWNRRLQQLSNRELSAYAADLLRLSLADQTAP